MIFTRKIFLNQTQTTNSHSFTPFLQRKILGAPMPGRLRIEHSMNFSNVHKFWEMAHTHTHTKQDSNFCNNFWAQSLKLLNIFDTYSTFKHGSKTSYQVTKLFVDTIDLQGRVPRSLICRYQHDTTKDVQKGIYVIDYRHLFSNIIQGFATDDLLHITSKYTILL